MFFFLKFLVISHPVQNMSTFLPKGAEAYSRPINYTPTSFVPSIKDIPPIDSNNNSNANENGSERFSPRSQTEQLFKPFIDQKPFDKTFESKPYDSKPFDTKPFDQKSLFANNNSNNNNNNEDNISSFPKDAILLPTSYSNNNTPTMSSMQTTLSSPSSITSNMSRSFSTSSYGKQESDEEIDDGGK